MNSFYLFWTFNWHLYLSTVLGLIVYSLLCFWFPRLLVKHYFLGKNIIKYLKGNNFLYGIEFKNYQLPSKSSYFITFLIGSIMLNSMLFTILIFPIFGLEFPLINSENIVDIQSYILVSNIHWSIIIFVTLVLFIIILLTTLRLLFKTNKSLENVIDDSYLQTIKDWINDKSNYDFEINSILKNRWEKFKHKSITKSCKKQKNIVTKLYDLRHTASQYYNNYENTKEAEYLIATAFKDCF